MRPRLMDDVRYVECQEGVHIQSGPDSCILQGRHVHQWITGLAPHLSDAHRDMVEDLARTPARGDAVSSLPPFVVQVVLCGD